MTIIVCGNFGSRPQQVSKLINRNFGHKPLTLQYDELPSKPSQQDIVILIDIPEELSKNRNPNVSWNEIVYYRAKLREYASKVGAYVIDGTLSSQKILNILYEILEKRSSQTKYLDVDHLTDEEFEKLPLIVEGESKIIRNAGNGLCVIKFKPTVYSYTYNRAGVVENTDILRVKCSRIFLDVLRVNGIKHSFVRVGEKFILSEIVKAPPIEIIVKAFHVGTPKYRYFAMSKYKVRNSHPTHAGFQIKDNGRYPIPFVRFDWRNPFKHPETGKKLADEVLCDDQADFYIDVKRAKATASKCFQVLSDFLNERDIVLLDICFMIDETGEKVYGEISQDCGRYQHKNISLDKDVWRSGGSSDMVITKWKKLLEILEKKPLQIPFKTQKSKTSSLREFLKSAKVEFLKSKL